MPNGTNSNEYTAKSDRNKILLLMCGPSFSGKTTLSKRIAQDICCTRISFDEINEKRGLVCAEFIPPEEWGKTSEEAIDLMRIEMNNDRLVVVDDTFCFGFLRKRFKDVADEYGYTTIIIYIDISVDTLRHRIERNKLQRSRSNIDKDVFENHINEFERPTINENITVFSPESEDLNDWLSDFYCRHKLQLQESRDWR